MYRNRMRIWFHRIKARWKMNKFMCMVILLLITITFCCRFITLILFSSMSNEPNNINPVSLRIVHIDLKGAPPKISYLNKILDYIVKAGGNGLLIEYEDMFPYKGKLVNISSKSAYNKKELGDFLEMCNKYHVEVIPLIQTFAHMEFILELPEFSYLRELPHDLQTVCPSHPDSIILIEDMIEQILTVHKYSKRIHIGCDEVFQLKQCSRCLALDLSSKDIFSVHVRDISTFIRKNYPGVNVIIWDDMMRDWSLKDLSKSDLNQYVEPMIWDYTENIAQTISQVTWMNYVNFFHQIWVASAFKGAFKPNATFPDMRIRYGNQKSWLNLLKSIQKPTRSKVQGYVLTGWSRYNHFTPLCELLPISFPSLILNLLKVNTTNTKEDRSIEMSYNEILQCSHQYTLAEIFNLNHTRNCYFPGSEILHGVIDLQTFLLKINDLYVMLREKNDLKDAGLFKGPGLDGVRAKAKSKFIENNFPDIYEQFSAITNRLKNDMRNYYYDDTITEWFRQNVDNYTIKIEILQKDFTSI